MQKRKSILRYEGNVFQNIRGLWVKRIDDKDRPWFSPLLVKTIFLCWKSILMYVKNVSLTKQNVLFLIFYMLCNFHQDRSKNEWRHSKWWRHYRKFHRKIPVHKKIKSTIIKTVVCLYISCPAFSNFNGRK